MSIHDNVKSEWSGIDVKDFGPYRESLAAALACRGWNDEKLRSELVKTPDLYFEKTGLARPESMSLRIVDKTPDEFVFVVPRNPPERELWYRYEQISNWWMLAHGFYWWMRREHGAKVDPFLGALNVQIIGRTWNDADWRARLLDDPRTTLEHETGGTFAPDLEVRAVEERDAHILVLPTDPAQERVTDGGEHLASLFSMGHTWWQWLVWPRLMRDVQGSDIEGMVK
nr:hypothetical protein [uncultured Halomonas sp.]